MPKINCKNCGEPCYLTEISKEGYCFECQEFYGTEEDLKEEENDR